MPTVGIEPTSQIISQVKLLHESYTRFRLFLYPATGRNRRMERMGIEPTTNGLPCWNIAVRACVQTHFFVALPAELPLRDFCYIYLIACKWVRHSTGDLHISMLIPVLQSKI